jgi:lysophospholipase L1-like esterase
MILLLFSIVVFVIAISITLIGYYFRNLLINENPNIWEKQVKKIESRYSGNYPQKSIIFIGSSSIEYWKTLDQDMAPLKVLNHGIAGTKVADVTYYAKRLIFPFNPETIVFYSGTNDINGIKSNSKTAEDVCQLTIEFFDSVHEKLPQVLIYYISISPSKARANVWREANMANQLIKSYCEKKEHVIFIDATEMLLDLNKKPKADIFRFDRLHFNKKGYAIWTSVIRPILIKENNDKY